MEFSDIRIQKKSPKPTIQEINRMLVELQIRLKAHLRADGLYEIRPTINGKQRSIYGHSAEELAQKYKALLKEKNKKRAETKRETARLYEWMDEWCTVYKLPNVKKNTYLNITRCIGKHLKGNLPNKELNKYDLTELTAALNKIESTRMRQYARGILKECFACAVTAGKLSASPAAYLAVVKHKAKNGKAFALTELLRLIQDAAQTLPKEALLYYLGCLFAGLRRDEGLNIVKDDCNFTDKILHVPGTKTDGSDRRMPMFPILEKILQAAHNDKRRKKVFNIPHYKADEYFQIFRQGNADAKQHWLRHTFGTIQICVLGIPANTVALWMGHSDASTTMDIYTHPEDLAPDIYFSGAYSEDEKRQILLARYNEIISFVDKIL